MLLYENSFLSINGEDDHVFLVVNTPGTTIQEFASLCKEVPRLKLTKFNAAKEALELPSGKPVLIGQLKDEIELTFSSDEMQAFVTLNMTEDVYKTKKVEIVTDILSLLKEEEVTVGIKAEVVQKTLLLNQAFTIAHGHPPIHGKDAIIRYYDFCEKKPVLKTDGKVNHYELNLIDNVDKGQWLGEKIPATLGEEGVSVRGNPISTKSGRDYKLKYDPKTVACEADSSGKEILKAKINGAVKMVNGKISVDNHLIINGDVEYTTGNIDFDGYVTVTGTVKDKFCVTATYDISINGPMGIGASGLIESRKGHVLIKGGINGKGESKVIAYGDIYTKYTNEASLEAGRNIHVGLYAIDSEMRAKKIILPPTVGRIIGGNSYAEHRIETGSIGNKSEKPTKISVEGFERGNIIEMLNYYNDKQASQVKLSNKLKRELEVFEKNIKKLDERGMTTYEYMLIKYDAVVSEVNELAVEIQKFEDVLRTRGEGEVSIGNSIFPKTSLEIKTLTKKIKDEMTGSFYVQEKTLHHTSKRKSE